MTVFTDERTAEPMPGAQFNDEPNIAVVAGHYELDLDRPLGSGGMAIVYRGRDLRTRRAVALKTLRLEYRRDPATRARFRREARLMAFLTHPNVARVYDLYEDDDAPWAVLELVPGRSLKELVHDDGPFSVDATALMLDQMADALDHLHGRGLVHLDVKPQNLIRTPDGTVKLIDFGLAQHAGTPQEMIGGTAFGTAAYLSPEQAMGEPVETATDVYALGCVVYELLTGRPPFDLNDGDLKNDVIRAHLEQAPESLTSIDPSLPAWIDDIVLGALAKRPADRYADCGSFARLYRFSLERDAGLDDAPTAQWWVPGVAETRSMPRPRRSNPLSRLAGASYRGGGRAARHTGHLQRLLWRLVAIVVVGNVLLAGLLYFEQGRVPGLYQQDRAISAGAAVEVVVDGARVRSAPGRDAEIVDQLPLGTRATVTGNARVIDGDTWWPVRARLADRTAVGYVSGSLIGAERTTGRDRLGHLLGRWRSVPDWIASRIGTS